MRSEDTKRRYLQAACGSEWTLQPARRPFPHGYRIPQVQVGPLFEVPAGAAAGEVSSGAGRRRVAGAARRYSPSGHAARGPLIEGRYRRERGRVGAVGAGLGGSIECAPQPDPLHAGSIQVGRVDRAGQYRLCGVGRGAIVIAAAPPAGRVGAEEAGGDAADDHQHAGHDAYLGAGR